MNTTLPDTITIPLGRNSVYGTMPVDCTKFPPHVVDHIWNYGVRQLLNDAMANKKDEDGADLPADQIVAKAQKRLDTLYSGELRAKGETAEPVDPVEAEAWKLAKAAMTKVYTEIGAFKDVPKGTKDRFAAVIANRRQMRELEELPADEAVRDAIERYLEANPAVRKQAARNVKEAREAQEHAREAII